MVDRGIDLDIRKNFSCRLLALTSVRLGYVSIEGFPQAPCLRELSLVGVTLTSVELNSLTSSSTCLVSLSMNGCNFEEDAAKTVLKPATSLQ